MKEGIYFGPDMHAKKRIRRFVLYLANKLFGPELTHRSKLVKTLNGIRIKMIQLLSPTHRRQARFERSNPEAPWFAPLSIPFIESILSPFFTGFEWGSGKSTLWFAKRVDKIISVEGRREWYEEVKKRVQREALEDKVDLHLVEVTSEFAFDPLEIERYAGAIDCIPDNSLDFIVIDGHFRVACLERCLNKLHAGGFVILDNSDLPEFERYHHLFCKLESYTFSNGIWETSIFKAPMADRFSIV